MNTETNNNYTASSFVDCTLEDFVNSGRDIITSPFKSSPLEYLKLTIGKSFTTHLWIVVAPILILSLLALIFDLRWILVALIFCFLVIPFIIANTYFSNLLTDEARIALSLKSIKIIPGNRMELNIMDNDGEIISTEIIQWSQIKAVTQRHDSWLIKLNKSHLVGIIIPNQAIIDITGQQNDDKQSQF